MNNSCFVERRILTLLSKQEFEIITKEKLLQKLSEIEWDDSECNKKGSVYERLVDCYYSYLVVP